MHWLERLARLQRKHLRTVNRRNEGAYRKRLREAGMRRVDAILSAGQYDVLLALQLPGETYSATIGRLIEHYR